MKNHHILYLFILLALKACIEPYDFEVDQAANTVIVDAELRDSLSLQKIKLSYLNELDNQQFNGVSNARVFVEDDLGNEVQFFEKEKGVYEAVFGANLDRQYKLSINIDKGGTIRSGFESLPPPIQLDSLSFEELQESFVNEDGKNRTLNVVKAYGETNISDNEDDLYIRFGNIETVFLFEERKKVTFPPPKNCFVYNKDVTPEIGIFNVNANSKDVKIKSLLFTKPINWEFGTVFSIKADLISMHRPYYEYWKEIENVYSQDGNINNPPPAQIRSNLSVENRPPVIGFFAMTRTSSKVLFVRKTDLKTSIILRCGSLSSPFPSPYPDECNECLLIDGASTTRPDYW